MHSDPTPDSPSAVRAAMIGHISRLLVPLFQSRNLRDELADWLAPLSTVALIRALGPNPSPNETAERLAAALLSDTSRRYPNDAVADLIAVEFPNATTADRARLIEFTAAVRRIAMECDGVVEARQLVAAGFRSADQARYMPRAEQVLAILNGNRAPSRSPEGTPATRLIEAGVRAASRRADALAVG